MLPGDVSRQTVVIRLRAAQRQTVLPRLRTHLAAPGPLGTPRWVAVVLLAFAAILVPWIALLALFNATTATAFHVPLMVGGVGAAASLLAASASYAAWRRSSAVVPVSLAATTLLTVTLLGAVTVGHPSWLFLAGGGACAMIALLAVVRVDRVGARRWPDALALAVVAAALAVATALIATRAPEQLIAHRVRAA